MPDNNIAKESICKCPKCGEPLTVIITTGEESVQDPLVAVYSSNLNNKGIAELKEFWAEKAKEDISSEAELRCRLSDDSLSNGCPNPLTPCEACPQHYYKTIGPTK